MLACSSSASLAAARAGGAAGSLSRQSQAALRAPSSRAQRALGRRLLQCRAEEGNGNGNGNHGNGNGNGNGQGESNGSAISQLAKAADKAGLSMGPISLTFGAPIEASPIQMTLGGSAAPEREFVDEDPAKPVVRLNPLSTEEWQKKFVNEDGTVDLWMEEEFNAASRMPAGRPYGRKENVAWSGKETADPDVPVYSVKITDKNSDQVLTVKAPQDRYVLFEAEDQGLDLPNACRHGCCTVCAVKVKSGTITQPEALGLSAGMKAKGYALLCVGFALSDLEVELQDPDEVYDMQFGQAFAELATNPDSPAVLRDDYALELATGDE